MSQYMPKTAMPRVPPRMASGIADHAGMPDTRSLNATSFFMGARRPLRWPMTTASRPAVATMAPAVAMITWLISAPPAGGVLAATAAGAATSVVAMAVRTATAVLAILDMRR